MEPVRVAFLGSGDAFSAGGRHQAAYLVLSREAHFLLDCGAATLASLKRDGLSTAAIDTVFLSHLHGDHFAGLPFLLLEYIYEEPRRRPLGIVGPPGTRRRVETLFRVMYRELAARPLPFRLEFTEIQPGQRFEAAGLAVDAFRVPHQEEEISLGLRVEVAGRKILYSGDTGWTEELVRHSQGTDLFICECCFFETRVSFHLDYPRLAENQGRFGAKQVILTHLGREVLSRRTEIGMKLAAEGSTVEI